ncbi:MAG: hypothetical protein JST40_11970 [Armatimonadetes bacterium]|nr:hypothetical protein [Armatimonadota bacterium]
MPLAQGNSWTYTQKAGLNTSVESIQVAAKDPVDGEQGYRLTGPGGDSRLVWTGGSLRAAELGGTNYAPSIVMLEPAAAYDPNSKEPRARAKPSKHIVTVGRRSYQATVTTVTSKSTIKLGGVDTDALQSEVSFQLEGREYSVLTWFTRGIGIVRQEVRSGTVLVRSLDYVKGP